MRFTTQGPKIAALSLFGMCLCVLFYCATSDYAELEGPQMVTAKYVVISQMSIKVQDAISPTTLDRAPNLSCATWYFVPPNPARPPPDLTRSWAAWYLFTLSVIVYLGSCVFGLPWKGLIASARETIASVEASTEVEAAGDCEAAGEAPADDGQGQGVVMNPIGGYRWGSSQT